MIEALIDECDHVRFKGLKSIITNLSWESIDLGKLQRPAEVTPPNWWVRIRESESPPKKYP